MRLPRRLALAATLTISVACGTGPGPTPAPTQAPAPEPMPVPPPALRVMTWNLQRGQAVAGPLAAADMAPFADVVAAHRADVVGLQEVTADQATAMSRTLGWGGPAYVETKQPCPGFPPPLAASCVPFGNAILSRHPLGEAEHWALPPSRLEASLEERVLLRAAVDAGAGGVFTVYVTHLAANATEREREAQAEAVLDLVAAEDPARPVLVGDFNADPTDDVVSTVTADFVDAWEEVRGDVGGFTANAVLRLVRRVDYVFVGRGSGLRVADVEVDRRVLSDHLPVVAELEA